MIGFDLLDEKVVALLTTIGIHIIHTYTIIKFQLTTNATHLYNTNDLVRECADTLNDGLFTLHSLVSSHYIEAPYSHWTVCYKNGDYKERRINTDIIFYNLTDMTSIETIANSYKDIFNLMRPSVEQNELDNLVITHVRNKHADFFVSRVLDNNLEDDGFNHICSLDKTRNYFINIQYCHPDMKERITLTLDKRFLIKGNIIFSSCFVLRCLNYQSIPFKFDNKYKLLIMDSDINNIELTHNKYIQLESDNYKVHNLPTTIEEKKTKLKSI